MQVAAWDLSPSLESSVGPLLRIGEVIAARRINKDEARLENLPTDDMPDGWEETREIKGLLGEPSTPYAWHDRMAAECEARRNLAGDTGTSTAWPASQRT